MVIAIDGPAGAGKSTVAALAAERLGALFLNSGSFYRGITLAAQRAGIPPEDAAAVIALAERLDMDYRGSRLCIAGEDVESLLHSDAVDARVSAVSAIPAVRRVVNGKLRRLARGRDIVCEGRDMTTVVFPDAEYKFYLDASLEAQAERRFRQGVSGMSLEEIRESLRKRDEMDKNKADGALKIAPDARYIDTTGLTLAEVCEILLNYIT